LRAVADLAVDVVLLDANPDGEAVDGIATALASRAIPFAFMTGCGCANLPAAFRDRPLLAKPFTQQQSLNTVAEQSSQTMAQSIG
jgi:hypothetical protein